MKYYTYLALGDSYTIGEQVPLAECFPCQTIQLLRKYATGKVKHLPMQIGNQHAEELLFAAPEIIANTGHTTDELEAAIRSAVLLPYYSFVTLLIGVNNQYRGRAVADFEQAFENLLQTAIQFTGGHSQHVFVLSIPDWGVTPFAASRDAISVSNEIDAYNLVCKNVSQKHGTNFIDITTAQRADVDKPGFLAADQLHPSGKEYAKWAVKLSEEIINYLK